MPLEDSLVYRSNPVHLRHEPTHAAHIQAIDAATEMTALRPGFVATRRHSPWQVARSGQGAPPMVLRRLPDIEPILPQPEDIRPVAALKSALRRIDGWGDLAWKEILGGWQVAAGVVLVICMPELDADGSEDERLWWLVIEHGFGVGDAVATADWALREIHRQWLPRAPLPVRVLQPGSAVRATTACMIRDGRLLLRGDVELPQLGFGIDAKRFGRFVAWCTAVAASCTNTRRRPALDRQRRSVARQRALRMALSDAGLVAFIGDGARLPRGEGGGPARRAVPMRAPRALATTLNLDAGGRVRGWGIRRGVTALIGAPYHGKSTVLKALQTGIDDHPPGDGRELVVADPSALLVQAEDGRRVQGTDLSWFFRALPGAVPSRFRTPCASGATSMAATIVEGLAAGTSLLLVDEDTAASNFLLIEPAMRSLLGRSLAGVRTLTEALPLLAEAEISTVLVAGSSVHPLAAADQVVAMDGWEPRLISLSRQPRIHRQPVQAWTTPQRRLQVSPDALFGVRNFVPMDLREPERPRLKLPDGWHQLDLRRSGWPLDAALVAGAMLAAGWCCRLAAKQPMATVREAYAAMVSDAANLDPFHTRPIAVPPWQLVVTVLERLPLSPSISAPQRHRIRRAHGP